MGNGQSGGLLLIDELDATLHPSAQNKLVEYLYKAAERTWYTKCIYCTALAYFQVLYATSEKT